MNALSQQLNQFNFPLDGAWMPLNLELPPAENKQTPSPAEIQAACTQISGRWDDREKEMRKFRSEKARESGICRNF